VSRRRCCCGSSCSNVVCGVVTSACGSTGMPIPSVRVNASVRIPGCYEPSCETFNAGPTETYDAVAPVGCIRCFPTYQAYPDCVPCRSDLLLGQSYWGNSNIIYTPADPRTFNATCDYSWNEGWYATDRICGPGSAEFMCYDGTTLIDANCAFLQYQSVSRSQTFTAAHWKTCGGGTPSIPVVSANARFGELCGGCSDVPQPCCCDDCTDCEQIRGDEVTFGNQNVIKQGRIRGRILQMLPCTGPSFASDYWCGSGCDPVNTENGYSRITIQLTADVPTVPISANLLFQTQGGLLPYTPGSVLLPRNLSFTQLGLADEDGEYWCVATSSITLTYRKCRTTINSATNKCQMEKGFYDLVFIGTSGTCPVVGPDCVQLVGTPCNTKELIQMAADLGWGVTLEVL
jgi:hypothetical protein